MRVYGVACGMLLWGWGFLLGQTVSIHGSNPDYSGKSLQITLDNNPFITIPGSVRRVVCTSLGHFEFSTEVESSTLIHVVTGVYRAYLFVEPGISYEIELPLYREKAYAEMISPFFQPLEVALKVLSRSSLDSNLCVNDAPELNHMIARFDTLFYEVNESVIMNRRIGKKSNLDSIERSIELTFAMDTAQFFVDYRRYKYGVLKLNEGRTGLETISRDYLGPVVRTSHPGFMELFGAMFKGFIYYYSRTPLGKDLWRHINRTQYIDSVRYTIGKHPAIWNDTLADMVLLQGLSNLFYEGNVHKDAILMLLDSMIQNPVSLHFAIYTSQLKRKLASLVIGHPPPEFQLSDLDGTLCTPRDFLGKYVYLMFCTPDNYGCMMEYPYLQSFILKHQAYLQVVTVMVAENELQVKEFMKRNGYDWKVLYFDGQPGILSDFLVKAFPTAYLIGPDGDLILSPSTLPSDGFEQQLFRIMRSKGEI